jgi:D-aspartate ligase
MVGQSSPAPDATPAGVAWWAMARAGAVVIGGYINGLGVVRALAARGVPVAVIETRPYDVAGHCRFLAGQERALDLEERPESLPEILERRRDWDGWALLPSTDGALAAVTDLRDELSPRHPIIAAPPEAVRCVLDKRRMREAAESVGISVPACHGPAASALLARPPRFPVVVKPNAGARFAARFGVKVLVARDAPELEACVARVEAAGLACEVYDLIPGADDQIYAYSTYLDRRGVPCGGLTIRKLRQSPPGFGVARLAELVPDPPGLREATIELARHIGLVGIAEAEWKRDERDGSFRFIEINGRSVIFNALLRRGGLDLAALAYGETVEGNLEAPSCAGWPGVWVNLHADLLHALLGRDETWTSWRQLFGPYRRPVLEAVWSARDPGPFLVQWGRSARAALGSLGGTARQQA